MGPVDDSATAYGFRHLQTERVVITYAALYLVSAVLTSFIVSPVDPGKEGEMEEDAIPTTA